MKYLLLIVASILFMNCCFAEKEIEICRMRKDSTFKAYRLKQNMEVKFRISTPNGESRYMYGKLGQITDSFAVIQGQNTYYDKIEEITYKAPEKKHVVQKIIAGVLVLPATTSLAVSGWGVYYLANKRKFYSSSNPYYSYDPMWGMIVVLGGVASFIGSATLLGLDLIFFDTHFTIYKLHPLESQGTHRWFIRVVEAQKK